MRPSCRWRARDLEPDKASVREALGRALFGARRYPRGGGGVRGRRRARADQRLRPVLPRSLTAAAGPPRRGAQAPGARLVPAPGARGLLRSTSVKRAAARPDAPRFRPVTVASMGANLAATAFWAGPGVGVVESGRSPLLPLEERSDPRCDSNSILANSHLDWSSIEFSS